MHDAYILESTSSHNVFSRSCLRCVRGRLLSDTMEVDLFNRGLLGFCTFRFFMYLAVYSRYCPVMNPSYENREPPCHAKAYIATVLRTQLMLNMVMALFYPSCAANGIQLPCLCSVPDTGTPVSGIILGTWIVTIGSVGALRWTVGKYHAHTIEAADETRRHVRCFLVHLHDYG